MIPWFICDLLDWAASLFGYNVYVRARSGNWFGAEAVFFVRNGGQRLKKIKARRP